MEARPIFQGTSRGLVLAIDIGTTYSGVSYAILDPNRPPVIESVKRYPGREGVIGEYKIPTVVLYGSDGAVRAVGAEAQDESFLEGIETGELTKAEWFKLHLCPKHLRKTQTFDNIPPLPLGKGLVTVLADFLLYLAKCTREFIIETQDKGAEFWDSERSIILTHPNGWEGAQQAIMRRAAIDAGLAPDTEEGRDSIHFVTEGEAALHYCLSNGLVPKELNPGDAVLVVDAGGGTVDITAYKKQSEQVFTEAAAPQCHFHGSVFVSQHARIFLRNFLHDSSYYEAVDDIANCFDKTTKLRFRDPKLPAFIKFGTIRDSDPNYNIRSGNLKLDGVQVSRFYEPAIDCISRVIMGYHQQNVGDAAQGSSHTASSRGNSQAGSESPRDSASYIKNVKMRCAFLVGGFAGNDWLYTSLKTRFELYNISIMRPDNHWSKATADGAVSFHLDHYVNVRVSKYIYGIKCGMFYNPEDTEHVARQATKYIDVDGAERVPDGFDIILPKGKEVAEVKEFRRAYSRCATNQSDLAVNLTVPIRCYRGPQKEPRWVPNAPQEDWDVVCNVVAEGRYINNIIKYQPATWIPPRFAHYRLQFEIILLFGFTELKAQICWKENGEEKRGPASVIYENVV